MRRTLLSVLLVVVTILGVVAVRDDRANAVGTWTVPGTAISGPDTVDPTPSIAVAPDGAIWVVTVTSTGLQLTKNLHGSWSTPEHLWTGAVLAQPILRFAANGDAAIAWIDNSNANARVARVARFVNGTWTANVAVSGADNPGEVRLGVSAAGRISVEWYQNNSGVLDLRVSTGAMTGSFGAAITLATNSANLYFDIVVDDVNGTTAIWQEWPNGLTRRAMVSTIAIGANTASAPTNISPTGLEVEHPNIRVNVNGDRVVVYRALNTDWKVYVVRSPAGSGWSTPVTPSTNGGDVYSNTDREFDVAIMNDGTAHIVWAVESVNPRWIRYLSMSPSGSLGPVLEVSPQSRAKFPFVTPLSNGDVLVSYVDQVGQNYYSAWMTALLPLGNASFDAPTMIVPEASSNRSWTRAVQDVRGELWVAQTSHVNNVQNSWASSVLHTGDGVPVTTSTSSTTSTTIAPSPRTEPTTTPADQVAAPAFAG